MKINNTQSIYLEKERHISNYKDFGNWINLYYDIFLLSEKFVEYQKDIFDEFLADIIDKLTLEEDNASINNFKKYFENRLQELNSKLNLFADKLKDIDKIDIKWVIQIFYNDMYMSCMIWDISLVIVRDRKLNYILNNEVESKSKIDSFSDFIEWWVENGDEILCLWLNVNQIMDEDDIKECIEIANIEDKEISKSFEDILLTRIKKEDIIFIISSKVEFEIILKQEKFKKDMVKNMWFLKNFKDLVIKFRYPIIVSISIIIIIFLLYSLIVNFMWKDSKKYSLVDNNSVIADFTIEDLRADFVKFTKLDPSSDEKWKIYNDLKKKLEILEQKWKEPHTVQEFKKELEWEYLRWFKINLLTANDLAESSVFKFSDEEKSTLWNMLSINYSSNGNGLMIWWTLWSIIWWVNDNVRWKLIKYNSTAQIKWCTTNLVQNWLYCFLDNAGIMDVLKTGEKNITTESSQFPSNIFDLWTYRTSSFYAFNGNKELNDKWVYITKYSIVWNQDNLSQGANYTIKEDFLKNNSANFSSGFASAAIDGSFLLWAKKNKSLYQFWKEGTTNVLNWRQIELKWGDNIDAFGENVKVITTFDSKKVYLFDKDTQTFTIYRSNPFKDNTQFTYSYWLTYFFRLKFDIWSKVVDTYIKTSSDNETLYLLTNDAVYQINLLDYAKSFEDK